MLGGALAAARLGDPEGGIGVDDEGGARGLDHGHLEVREPRKEGAEEEVGVVEL